MSISVRNLSMAITHKLLVPLVLVTIVGLAPRSLAHMVESNYILTDQLEFTSTFSTGEAFADAPVKVYAPNDPEKPWLETKTDANGKFAFKPDPTLPGNWEVQIGEGGHFDSYIVPVASQGVQLDQIVDTGHRDVHYAASPLLLAGATLGVASGIGTAYLMRRRSPHA
ncbi:carboxypeptidase regulatory-like domain-containing protein [Trichothermofontia sp.]